MQVALKDFWITLLKPNHLIPSARRTGIYISEVFSKKRFFHYCIYYDFFFSFLFLFHFLFASVKVSFISQAILGCHLPHGSRRHGPIERMSSLSPLLHPLILFFSLFSLLSLSFLLFSFSSAVLIFLL